MVKNCIKALNMRSTLRLLVCVLVVSFHLSIAEEHAAAGGGTIHGRLQFPDQSPFNATHTRVVLNHGQRITYPQLDGQFAFTDVPPGVHVIDVHNPTYHFSQFKVQILADDTAHPKVLEYYYPGAPKQPVTLPLVWTPLATYDYFEPRPRFSMFGMLRNPMVLMMLVMGGMMVRTIAVCIRRGVRCKSCIVSCGLLL